MPVSLYYILLVFACCSCAHAITPVANSSYSGNSAIAPDYTNLDAWAAHPRLHDPADSIPLPLRGEATDTIADVFFVHPTTFTNHEETQRWNAPVDDEVLNAKTDSSTILYQASIFNQHSRVFAPRYRQAHIRAFFSKDAAASAAFDIAYDDIRQAFQHYLQYENKGRPIIVAAHSQGSKLAIRLLQEFFDQKPLAKQLVVAYVVGWPVPVSSFREISACQDSLQTGCICSWRTFRKGYQPDYIQQETSPVMVTNPLSWQTSGEKISRFQNKGSFLRDFNKRYTHVAGAVVHDHVLWIRKPKFPGGLFYFSKNYHIADYNLYYLSVRQNVSARLRAWFSHQQSANLED